MENMALSVAGKQEAKNQKVTSFEAKNQKATSFEPVSVCSGLSHRSQGLGLASCDMMVNITRNSK